jgi:hypothetical protein
MTDQHRFAYADHLDHDLYTRTRTTDRVLNAAIVRADISESFEKCEFSGKQVGQIGLCFWSKMISHTPTLRMRLTLSAPSSDE